MREVILAVSVGHLFIDIGRGLNESFNMLWDTLWAMILGFGLSGIIQAFVSRRQMQARLGNHEPNSVGRASFYGMISSSCSYAASAMAKSLFLRGADFVASMVFMFASTNLVIELGIVLIVLIVWQFAVAEFVGGAIMIVLLVIFGAIWFRGRAVAEARRNVENGVSEHSPISSVDEMGEKPLRVRMRSLAAWSDAASYTMSDLTMLRKEIVVGFLIAGFLAALVNVQVWKIVFFSGHGLATNIENAIVGPLIALLSFVCSIGNVPLAAALWKGGISFSGVVSFIFADLLSLPLLLTYRKFYGTRMALRMMGVFWFVISLAGLITEGIFHLFGAVPTIRPKVVASNSFGFNYTTVLDVIFLILFAGMYWLYRNKERFGGGSGYAKDLVCGMQVEVANAPATVNFENTPYYFCSNRCSERFSANPKRFTTVSQLENKEQLSMEDDPEDQQGVIGHIDPVCGMTVDPENAAASQSYEGREFYFCSTGCSSRFRENPRSYV